jgi:hypothetical protein
MFMIYSMVVVKLKLCFGFPYYNSAWYPGRIAPYMIQYYHMRIR